MTPEGPQKKRKTISTTLVELERQSIISAEWARKINKTNIVVITKMESHFEGQHWASN